MQITCRTLSLLGTVIMIPWDLFLAFGFTFTSAEHITFTDWIFIWATFYLTIPAVLISWVLPKLAAYWIIVNTAASMSVVGFREINWYLQYRHSPYDLATPLPLAFVFEAFWYFFCFWIFKLFFGAGLLYVSKRRKPAQ